MINGVIFIKSKEKLRLYWTYLQILYSYSMAKIEVKYFVPFAIVFTVSQNLTKLSVSAIYNTRNSSFSSLSSISSISSLSTKIPAPLQKQYWLIMNYVSSANCNNDNDGDNIVRKDALIN